jgi:hypothetical protein
LPALVLALRKYASVWRCMMVRQPPWLVAGLIQAASVMADPRFSEAADGTWTSEATPSKARPPPYLPVVQMAGPVIEAGVAVARQVGHGPCPRRPRRRSRRPARAGPVGAAGVVAEATLE